MLTVANCSLVQKKYHARGIVFFLELAGFGPATFCSPPQNKSFAGTPKYNQQVPTVTNCSLVQKKYHARGIVFFLELAGFGPATFCSPPQNKSFAGTPKYNQQVPTVTNCSLVQKKYHARGIVFFLELAGFGPATFCSPPQNKSFAGTPKYNQQVPTVTNCSLVQKKYHARGIVFFFGASGRIRTGDLLITNQLLYLLSHTSNFRLLLDYIKLKKKMQSIFQYP